MLQQISPVVPYKPDGGYTQSGLMSMLGAMVVVGGVLGYAAHHIQQYFWLILLFPAAMGFVLGWVGVWCIGKGRIRNQFIGGAMGFVGGVLAMVVMHHFDYEAFQKQLAEYAEEVEVVRAMSPAEREETVRTSEDPEATQGFIELALIDSFVDYLQWEADQGIRISKAGTGDGGAPITGIGVWIYWVIELLIVAVVAFFMMRARAAEPYSRLSTDWKKPVWLGSFDLGMLNSAHVALSTGNLDQLQACAPSPDAGPVLASAYVASGQEHADAVDVRLEAFTDGKTKKTIGTYTYPAGSLPALQAAFTPAPPPPEEPAADPVEG
jgi:hypothetical protein